MLSEREGWTFRIREIVYLHRVYIREMIMIFVRNTLVAMEIKHMRFLDFSDLKVDKL